MNTKLALLIVAAAVMPSLALADTAAGRAKFESACADCHEPADFADKSGAQLQTQLKGISSGQIKHKGKVKLTDAEIADLVAHLAPCATATASPASGAAAKDPVGTRASMPVPEKPASASPAAANPAPKPAGASAASVPVSKTPPAASAAASAAVGGTAASAVATTTKVAGNPAVTGAGKALFEKACADCHEVVDFAGQPAADLQERLGAIVAGKVKHKPALKLSDAERQSVAAYLSAGK